MNILQTIEADLTAAGGWIEHEAEAAAAVLWADAKAVLTAVKPVVYVELRKVIVGVLTAFKGKEIADIETALLNVLSAAESDLLAEAKAMGSSLLQRLIAQVMGA